MGEKKVKRHVRSPRRFPPLNKSNEGYCSMHCFYFIGVVTGCGAVLIGLSLNISLEQGGQILSGQNSSENITVKTNSTNSQQETKSFSQHNNGQSSPTKNVTTSKATEAGGAQSSQNKFVWLSEIHYSQYDRRISAEIRSGAKYLESAESVSDAVDYYESLVNANPKSAQAHYMLALANFKLADKMRSNKLLLKTIKLLNVALECPDISAPAEIAISSLMAEKLQFLGKMSRAVRIWELLVNKYPDHTELLNELGTAYCYNEREKPSKEKARITFEKVLEIDPDNGYAAAHLGFVKYVYERDAAGGAPLLVQGLNSGDDRVTRDNRFYSKAGDALYRVGQKEQATAIFKQAAERGLFLSETQRSTINVDHLTGRGWWSLSDLPISYQYHLKRLEKHWKTIRDEGLSLIDKETGLFQAEDENLREYGNWKQFTLFIRGKEQQAACQKAPKTCELMRPFKAATTNKVGQVKFSLLFPGTRVWPHTGPTNCRIRPHLGLKVPSGVGIEVDGRQGVWKEGEFIIIDDSFEHHVWHEGTEPRLILIVDVWHPELTEKERRTLSPI